jgi:3-oxoacyl-[acyl-carrier protein] reductase
MDTTIKAMFVDLSGRAAVVTGGGTGIGRAISMGLARCDCAVAVNYSRSRGEAEETVRAIEKAGGRAVAIQADVTVEAQVEDLLAQTCDRFGGLDILVANAGGHTAICPTADLTDDLWNEGMALNCKSVFYCVKHAAGRIRKETGRIIITSSISARSGSGPGMIVYAASKGAVNNMVRGWAKEYAPVGVTVNAIAPGVIRTRIHQRITPPDEYQRLIERIPLKRDGLPEDCVGAVLLLASDEGGYITGQIIEINGGMQMP